MLKTSCRSDNIHGTMFQIQDPSSEQFHHLAVETDESSFYFWPENKAISSES